MKKNFLTGFIILMPLYITYIVCAFIVNLLTNPFFEHIEAAWGDQILLQVITQILIIFAMLGLISVVGFLAEAVIGSFFIGITNKIFYRIPLVNKIYKGAQEIIQTILGSNKSGFSDVVLVPYPYEDTYSIGFVTQKNNSNEQISVFLPGVPNPSIGFLILFEANDVIFLDMKVEQAMKYLISCGVSIPSFSLKSES